jgi:hypothetical protein
LQTGEIDWWELPTPELRAHFRSDPKIAVDAMDPRGFGSNRGKTLGSFNR